MDVALVGLIGAVLGVLVSNLIERALEIKRRHDREMDLTIAVHAEITASLKRAEEQTAQAERDYVTRDEDPFGIADATDYVFESLKDDPSALPKAVIHSVIRYYKLAGQSNLYTSGFADPRYGLQTPEAKLKYRRNLLSLLDEQERAGRDALRDLEREALKRGVEDLPERRRMMGVVFSDEGLDGTGHR